ncbi:MAG: transporter [Pirellulaceae bacterium]
MNRFFHTISSLTLIAILVISTPVQGEDLLAPLPTFKEMLQADSGESEPISFDRPDTHAPGQLMGDHLHAPGSQMFEYKYMNMSMSGLLTGDDEISNMAAQSYNGADYMAVPTKMNMEMHMMHYMVGWHENVTLYIMPMWVVNTMESTTYMDGGMGSMPMGTMRRSNGGFADLPFGGLWLLKKNSFGELIANIGVSAPTGDIDNQTTNPMNGMPMEFPYAMRTGAGHWRALPGLTYKRLDDGGSLGVQIQSAIALGTNDESYSVGDEYRLSFWKTKLIDDQKRLAFSARIESLWRGSIQGADADLMMGMSPVANASFSGGNWINLGLGGIYTLDSGARLNLEFGIPLYQHVDGIQMRQDWTLAASWSKSF